MVMEGWLYKRGPTSDYKWMRRWCVLTNQNLEYFADEQRQLKKGAFNLRRTTRASAFQSSYRGQNLQAPGAVALHWQEKPYGFVVDVDPAGGLRRHFYYFDAESSAALEAWTAAFGRISQGEAAAAAAAAPPPATAAIAARGSVFRALQGAASRKSAVEASSIEASRRASSVLVSSLLSRCSQEKEVPVEQRRLSEAQSESKRCSKVGGAHGLVGLLVEERHRRDSQDTILAPSRFSLLPVAGSTDADDKVAYVRASMTGQRGLFPVGRTSTLQLQLCPEVCGESSSSSSSSDDEEVHDKKPRKVRNPLRAKALCDVERNANAFQDLLDEFRADKEIALAAVKGNPDMLAFASKELRSDREVVFASVQRDGRALRHSVLQADRDIVMAAAMQNSDALDYADEALKKDTSLMSF